MKSYKDILPELQLKYVNGTFKKYKVNSSKDSFDILKEMYDQDTIEYNESVIVIFFDTGNRSIGWTRHSSGGTAHSVVDQKMILTEALLCGAASLILSHNHPSGEMRPSSQDTSVTHKLKDACNAIGLRLLDHIIVSGDKTSYYSFVDEGII